MCLHLVNYDFFVDVVHCFPKKMICPENQCRRFLKGYNFLPWFRRKRAVAEQEQYKLWRQARIKTNIHQLISKMSELEIVDSFNAIERHLYGEMQASFLLNSIKYFHRNEY